MGSVNLSGHVQGRCSHHADEAILVPAVCADASGQPPIRVGEPEDCRAKSLVVSAISARVGELNVI